MRTIPRIKLPFPRRGGNGENDPVAVPSTLASNNPGGFLASPGIALQHSSTLGGDNGDVAEERLKVRYQLVMMTISMKTIARALEVQ